MNTFNFAGLKFTQLNLDSCIAKTEQAIQDKKKFVVAVPSSRMVVHAQKDIEYRSYVNKAELVIPDSISIVLVSWLSPNKIPWRIAGPDFMLKLCEVASKKKYSVYFLGATEHVLKKMTAYLKNKYPLLNICGYQPLPFGDVSKMGFAGIIDNINNSNPDILFVSMSAPKQERWIDSNINYVNAFIFVGVGAAFDYFAGVVPRAPKVLRLVGLEWLHRHIVDPKRNLGQIKQRLPDYLYLVFITILVNHPFFLKLYQFFKTTINEGFMIGLNKVLRQFIKIDQRYIFIRDAKQILEPSPTLRYEELSQDILTNIQHDRSLDFIEKFWNITNAAKRCFGCFHRDNLIHVSWVFESNCSSIELSENEVFIGPCITFPEARRLGAYRNTLIYVSNLLKREGFINIYGSTNFDNKASIDGFIKAGFKISHIQKNIFILSKCIRRKKIDFAKNVNNMN
ncbi:MAG TPA: WecB/TagA/CpsF family glycosyltransferase [Smithellaceae bacterium]|nr:WecB/TagA/CpsF family glycosyltransferase [Smithellaceae bacterium]